MKFYSENELHKIKQEKVNLNLISISGMKKHILKSTNLLEIFVAVIYTVGVVASRVFGERTSCPDSRVIGLEVRIYGQAAIKHQA